MAQEIRDPQELELRLQQADSNQRTGRAYREAPKLRLRQIKEELSRLMPKLRENGQP